MSNINTECFVILFSGPIVCSVTGSENSIPLRDVFVFRIEVISVYYFKQKANWIFLKLFFAYRTGFYIHFERK